MNWRYQSKEINTIEELPKNTFGFIYEVEHIPTGKKYIGKKVLYHNKTLPPLKGTKRKRKVVRESDWKTYYGSQQDIKGLIKEGKQEEFKRTILRLVESKKLLTYYETKELFVKEVIEPGSNYYNDNIGGKFYKRDFTL